MLSTIFKLYTLIFFKWLSLMLKMLVWQAPPFPGGATELEYTIYISTKSLRRVLRNDLEINIKEEDRE